MVLHWWHVSNCRLCHCHLQWYLATKITLLRISLFLSGEWVYPVTKHFVLLCQRSKSNLFLQTWFKLKRNSYCYVAYVFILNMNKQAWEENKCMILHNTAFILPSENLQQSKFLQLYKMRWKCRCEILRFSLFQIHGTALSRGTGNPSVSILS